MCLGCYLWLLHSAFLYVVWMVVIKSKVFSGKGWLVIYGTLKSWNYSQCGLLVHPERLAEYCFFHCELDWRSYWVHMASSTCTASWWGLNIKVSSMYLRYRVVNLKFISSKYSIYISAIAGVNGKPIAKFGIFWKLTVEKLIFLLISSLLSPTVSWWIVIKAADSVPYISTRSLSYFSKLSQAFKFRLSDWLNIIFRKDSLLKIFSSSFLLSLPWTRHYVTIIRLRIKTFQDRHIRNHHWNKNMAMTVN